MLAVPTGDNDDSELSEQERAALADLEAALADVDPKLGHRLGFRRPLVSKLRPVSKLKPGQQLAVAAGAIVVGLLIVIATFTVSLWAALPGLIIVAGAIWLAVQAVPRVGALPKRPRRSR
jgi:hypothetical protein